MARRMFSPQIIDSDAFLDMSPSAQNLYFHLSMRADDDGFVSSPKKILKIAGGGEDDYKLLQVKRFILPFESGIIVIKHWRINNYIRKDIYEPTRYTEEKNKLLIKSNGAYTFNSKEGVKLPEGHFTLEDIDKITCTQRALPVHLGKDRIGKVSKDKITIAETSPAEWSLENSLSKMEEKEGSYLDYIASFIREKPVKIENSKQLSAVITRHCRTAKLLEGYSPKDVFNAIDTLKKDNEKRRDKIEWTMETILKVLTK